MPGVLATPSAGYALCSSLIHIFSSSYLPVLLFLTPPQLPLPLTTLQHGGLSPTSANQMSLSPEAPLQPQSLPRSTLPITQSPSPTLSVLRNSPTPLKVWQFMPLPHKLLSSFLMVFSHPLTLQAQTRTSGYVQPPN